MVIKLGIVGYKNHAERLGKIIHSMKIYQVKFYHPTKKNKNITNNFQDLLELDAVIISSPNSTHYEYIKKLIKNNYSGYIFCEKPPAINKIQLNYLKKLNKNIKSKIFFNFNYRFSNFNKILKENLNSKKIGKVIYVSFISSHGLAFKKQYLNSWRAKGKNNLYNILETVSIHYVDLAILNFGNIEKIYNSSKSISKNGSSFDTTSLILNHKNGITTTIFNSYATPLINELMIIGTNGYIVIRNDKLKIFSPRNVFDKKGFFVSPIGSKSKIFSMNKDYESSLKKSMEFFLSCVKNNKKLPINEFETSLQTNELILKITRKI